MNKKEFLLLSIMTFITVVLWTGFEVYHTHQASTVPNLLLEQIEPLDPQLETKIIEKLKDRLTEENLSIAPVSTTSFSVSITPTSSPTPTPTP